MVCNKCAKKIHLIISCSRVLGVLCAFLLCYGWRGETLDALKMQSS